MNNDVWTMLGVIATAASAIASFIEASLPCVGRKPG